VKLPKLCIGSPTRFEALLQKYYDGEIGMLMLSLSWGGYEKRDTDTLEGCGLFYRSFRVDGVGTTNDFTNLRDERWRPVRPFYPPEKFFDYLSRESDFIAELLNEIGSRDKGVYFEF
jgi:hypothetical protein